MKTVIVNPPVCDFCSAEEVVVGYLVSDFILPQYAWGSVGGFAACSICKRLVESNQRAALEKRALDSFVERYGRLIPTELTQMFIHDLHVEFWKQLDERRKHAPGEVPQNHVH